MFVQRDDRDARVVKIQAESLLTRIPTTRRAAPRRAVVEALSGQPLNLVRSRNDCFDLTSIFSEPWHLLTAGDIIGGVNSVGKCSWGSRLVGDLCWQTTPLTITRVPDGWRFRKMITLKLTSEAEMPRKFIKRIPNVKSLNVEADAWSYAKF